MIDPSISFQLWQQGRSSEKYLKVQELKAFHAYLISAHHSNVGIWNPDRKAFLVLREKLGEYRLFYEFHFDVGTPSYGTAKPFLAFEQCPAHLTFDQWAFSNSYRPLLRLGLVCYLREIETSYPIKELLINHLSSVKK